MHIKQGAHTVTASVTLTKVEYYEALRAKIVEKCRDLGTYEVSHVVRPSEYNSSVEVQLLRIEAPAKDVVYYE